MRRIGHELSLGAKGIAHAPQQRIHDLREPPQLVVRIHDLQAIVEIGRRDAGGAGCHRVEGFQTAPRQRIAGDDRREQRQWNGQQQRVPYRAQQQAIVLERVQRGHQQRRLARVLRHRGQTGDAGSPIRTAHANRAEGNLTLIGDLAGACLHDVAQQRAHGIGQHHGFVAPAAGRTRWSGLTGRHELGALVGDEHFEVADTQLAQHGLLGFSAHFFHIAAGLSSRPFGANGAGHYPRRFANGRVGALLQGGREREPAGDGERAEHEGEHAGVPEREAHPDGEPHGAACDRIGHVGTTSESTYPARRRVWMSGVHGARSIFPRSRFTYTSTALVNGS